MSIPGVGLNTEQLAVMHAVSGPVVVEAGPGSGKTRAVTHRIQYLVNDVGAAPHKILAVTFTRKAAREMQERLALMLPADVAKEVSLSTFHSFCGRVLREQKAHFPWQLLERPTLYKPEDQKALIKEILLGRYSFPSDDEYEAFKGLNLTWVLARLRFAWAMEDRSLAFKDSPLYGDMEANLWNLFDVYLDEMRKAAAVDYDSLQGHVLRLFREHDDIARHYAKRFPHIMVDEFQDTDPVQAGVIRHITRAKGEKTGEFRVKSLCVVGDADQSIYSFRGADITNIQNFEETYPGALRLSLGTNYRSSKRIVQTCRHLIEQEKDRGSKDLRTPNDEGPNPIYQHHEDNDGEARWVAAAIMKLNSQGMNLREIAVLYRTSMQSRALETAIRRARIPYEVIGDVSFYQRKEILDLTAWINFIANPRTEPHFRRAAGTVPGLGKTSITRIVDHAFKRQVDFLEACKAVAGLPSTRKKARDAIRTLLQVEEACQKERSGDLINVLVTQLQYRVYLRSTEKKPSLLEDRLDNVDELIRVWRSFVRETQEVGQTPDPAAFLEEIALDWEPRDDGRKAKEAVSLMTAHRSKGLEFDTVFMTGVNEGIIPHARSLGEKGGVNEERRVLYVAFSRARRVLAVSSYTYGTGFGQGDRPRFKRSQFLPEAWTARYD